MPVLEKFAPLRDLDLMERRMRRMFSDLPFSFSPAMAPAADVYETEGEFVVEVEVPGFEETDLDVEVSGHTLIVKGEREAVTEKAEKTLHVHERLESSFERRFELPLETDSSGLSALFTKGVLTLHVPKTAVQPHKVPISTS